MRSEGSLVEWSRHCIVDIPKEFLFDTISDKWLLRESFSAAVGTQASSVLSTGKTECVSVHWGVLCETCVEWCVMTCFMKCGI